MVRFHNGVELYRGVPLLTSPRERVLAERASDPAAPRVAGDHEARGGDVRARTGTIRSHLRRPEHPGALAGYNRATGRGLYPHFLGRLGRPSRVVSESVAIGDDLPEDGPDRRPVGVEVSTNSHGDILIEAPNQSRSKAIPTLDSLPPEIKLLSPFFTLSLEGHERAAA